MIKPALILLAGSLIASAAFAEPQRPDESNGLSTSFLALHDAAQDQHDIFLNQVGQRKIALRDEAMQLKAADGGTLTAAHRAYLQRKLDRINGA